MNSIRTFIALDLSAGNRASIAKVVRKLSPGCDGIKWVNPDLLHLTLHFLGDVLYTDIKRVCEVAQAATSSIDPFEIHLEGLGAFPDFDRPRVVWVGVSEGHPQVVELQRALKDALGQLGYPSDKNVFKPHITIGRIKRHGDLGDLKSLAEPFAEKDFGRCGVDEVTVYQSDLHRSGPEYTPIAELELG